MPTRVVSVVPVHWSTGRWWNLRVGGWAGQYGGRDFEFLFERKRIKAIPRNLRATNLRSRFDAAISKTTGDRDFVSWWMQLAGLAAPCFSLQFSDGEWDVPWELLVERLQFPALRRAVAFTRRVAREEAAAPSHFSENLRTLLVLGADNPPSGSRLALQHEADLILESWSRLDHASAHAIDKPAIIRANAATLAEEIARYRPHLVLYSGHGRNSPPAVQMADGSWMGAQQYAEAITPGWIPVFAGFWACSTARRDPQDVATPGGPRFAEELLRRNVLSVLAMQSPIGDSNALVLARTFFEALAAGRTMERAVAEARAVLLDQARPGPGALDWASPVVWTASHSVPALVWRAPGAQMVQRQLASRRILAEGAGPSLTLTGADERLVPTATDESRATAWVDAGRVWVQGEVSDALLRDEWVRTLAAVQRTRSKAVVAVEMTGQTPYALEVWAERVEKSFLPSELPDDVAFAIREIQRAPQRGWKRLCSIPDIVIAVSGNAPRDQDLEWFWAPFHNSHLQALVLSPDAEPLLDDGTWAFDSLVVSMTDQDIDDAVHSAPRLARALAILNAPIAEDFVEIHNDTGASTLADWPAGKPILARLGTSVVLLTTARRKILDRATESEITQAHLDASVLLGHEQLQLTEDIRLRRVEHLLLGRNAQLTNEAADLEQFAAIEIAGLFGIYRSTERPRALVELDRRIRGWNAAVRQVLPYDAKLNLAWAYLRIGQVAQARYWLERANPLAPLDAAFKHGLSAELLKSDDGGGAREDVLREIDLAIEKCEKALAAARTAGTGEQFVESRLRAYQHDRARILHYLFYRLEDARREYERLIAAWTSEPMAGLNLAIVRRNYAEVLRQLGRATGDDALLRKAGREIELALDVARQFPMSTVVAEVEYEAARDARDRGAAAGEKRHIDAAISAARDSGYDMVVAIAENRRFWHFEQFSADKWQRIASSLAEFPAHGWATRTLVDSSLCAANEFLERGAIEEATAEIERAQLAMQLHPRFIDGSDRWRRATIAAGFTVVGRSDAAEIWDGFARENHWAQQWMTRNEVRDPNSTWQRRIAETCHRQEGE